MKRQQLFERIETVLRRRREAVRQSLAGELGQLGTAHNSAVGDPVDAALDTEYKAINSELAEAESRELAYIERALDRIREGSYGLCESCGQKIPAARLQALPYATMCIRCQKLQEEEDRREPMERGRYHTGGMTADFDDMTASTF